MEKINNKNKSVVLIILILLYLLFYRLIVLDKLLFYEEFITSSFLIILTFITLVFLGFRKDKISRLNHTILILTVTSVCLYFTLTYLIGFMNGFLKNSYSLRINDVFMNMICPFINVIALEIIRFSLLQNNKKDPKMVRLITITYILFEIFLSIDFYNLKTLDGIFEFICLLLLKTIFENIFLTYTSMNFGINIPLIYRCTLSLYIYFIPILPDLGIIFNAIINILFPFILWNKINIINYEEEIRKPYKPNTNLFQIKDYVAYGSVVVIFILVSNLFPIKLVSIASGSMDPNIRVGDAVLINGFYDLDKIKVGDVISMKKDNRVVVHRVVEITTENGETIYRTKGDANNAADSFITRKEEIEGKMVTSIPLVGYPALFLTNMKGR